MVEQGSWCAAGVGDAGLDVLPVDPFGDGIRWTAVDLAECPDQDEELQRVLAGERADRLVDDWWADPGAARRDWDADLARLSALVVADEQQDAVARRTALDGVPGVGALVAVREVLDGAAAWTAEQAAVEGFVDELQDAAVSGFAAAHRLGNFALWLQVALAAKVVTAWTGRTPSLPRRTRSGRLVMDDQDVLVDGSVALELAVAAGITQGKAAALVDAATALVIDEKLPLTAQALAHGLLDWPRLRMVVSRTRGLTVEALLYATRGVLDGGTRRFDAALTGAVLAVDAEAEARRRRRNRKSRRVSVQTTDDGAALLTAVGPGEAITAAYNGLEAAARYLRRHGDPRTLDQLRHDLFVTGCTSGYLPVPADALPIPPGCVPTSAQVSPADPVSPGDAAGSNGAVAADPACSDSDSDEEPIPAWFTTTWPAVQVAVNVTVSAETLMGLVNAPGTLQGYGPIPADAIRDLVKNGVFRCLVVDGEHGTVLGVGKNTFSPGYVASERLKLLVEHAYPTCTAPHCEKSSWRCDLDHSTPHAQGGATCECTVRPLCRPCHRLKTAGLLVPQQRHRPGDAPGTTTWTTRTGRAYTALPHTPLPNVALPDIALPDVASRSTTRAAMDATAAEDPPPF